MPGPATATVIATPDTLAIMRARLGDGAGAVQKPLPYGQTVELGEVRLRLVPAGHVLGSAQVVMEYAGTRVVVSGDYKRTARSHLPAVRAGRLRPVRHRGDLRPAGVPPSAGRATRSPGCCIPCALFPERCHVIGAYALGKAQRMIALLREAGWQRPIFLHGALQALCDLYARQGVDLGELRPATAGEKGVPRQDLMGEIVDRPARCASPSAGRGACRTRWSARPRAGCGSSSAPGRAASSCRWSSPTMPTGTSCWPRSTRSQAPEIWVTHGREEALVHAATQRGIRARALALVGYEDEPA